MSTLQTSAPKTGLMKFLIVFVFASVGKVASFAQQNSGAQQTFTINSRVHIRALEILNDSTAWFGANRGVWGFTKNGGRTWTVDSIRINNIAPQFRSLSVLNDSTALLLSIDSPAYLMKTVNYGKTWKVVYSDNRKGIFFDCLYFSDSENGYALGDPIDSCFQLITTNDGGETWNNTTCRAIPKAHDGEACFAASNSNLVVRGKRIWFVTGGKHSRIFSSTNTGKSFTTFPTPLPKGETMTGIFAFDFLDDKKGAITGGHYEKTDSTITSLAITDDGGRSWKAIKTDRPFFGSCVRFISKDKLIVTGHNGTYQVEIKSGKTLEIKNENGEPLKYYTLRVTPGRKYVWLAGSAGKLARIKIED